MAVSSDNFITNDPATDYVLGNSDAEHERLIRQAARLAPLTKRFLHEAGIGSGQRILDIGSGVGDVAMLAAQMVGTAGEVIGIERDPRTIARARARVAAAGLKNVSFVRSDINQIASNKPFDAVIGRFVMMFLPDPVSVLSSLSQIVRPGGVIAFLENSWSPFLLLSAHLPLWSAGASLIYEIFKRSGANMEMGLALFRMFEEAGLPAPTMKLEMLLGNDSETTRYISDVLSSLHPHIEKLGLSLAKVGNLDTLQGRLQAEVSASKTVVPWPGYVWVWSRKPTIGASC